VSTINIRAERWGREVRLIISLDSETAASALIEAIQKQITAGHLEFEFDAPHEITHQHQRH
jgi:hypothetical protein